MTGKVYKVIGLMSGTSLDGIDVAWLETDGQTLSHIGPSLSVPYSPDIQAELREVMVQAVSWGFNGPPPDRLAETEQRLDAAHIDAVQRFMSENGLSADDVDLIGYHGQTVLHRAATQGHKGATLQLGDGTRLARELGTRTVYDFRSADVAAGGQGAPLAPIYHKALMDSAGLKNVALLNIGGVSNVSLIDGDGLLASDCGPGNGPLDSWTMRHTSQSFDAGGALARRGTPDFAQIETWMQRPFYALPLPRSADRYDFDVLPEMTALTAEDGAATLVAYIAEGIARTLRDMSQNPTELIICGGGRHNPIIMAALAQRLPCPVRPCEAYGWDGDALEAHAFAYLAARHLAGLPVSYPGTTGAPQALRGGRMAMP